MLSEKEFKQLKKDLDAAHKEVKECDGKNFVLFENAYRKYIALHDKYCAECDARLDASGLMDSNPELYALLKGLTIRGK